MLCSGSQRDEGASGKRTRRIGLPSCFKAEKKTKMVSVLKQVRVLGQVLGGCASIAHLQPYRLRVS